MAVWFVRFIKLLVVVWFNFELYYGGLVFYISESILMELLYWFSVALYMYRIPSHTYTTVVVFSGHDIFNWLQISSPSVAIKHNFAAILANLQPSNPILQQYPSINSHQNKICSHTLQPTAPVVVVSPLLHHSNPYRQPNTIQTLASPLYYRP